MGSAIQMHSYPVYFIHSLRGVIDKLIAVIDDLSDTSDLFAVQYKFSQH